MDIPINVNVICADEICGRSTKLVINPVNEKITHLVVAEKDFPNIERLVPIENILSSTPTSIHLRCDKKTLSKMETFMETDFIESGNLDAAYPFDDPFLVWPYSIYDRAAIPMEHEHIPANEVVIRRSTPVKGIDGQVGKVDEFLISPENDSISHLVMREKHLWGTKDVTIPVSEIERITDDAVYLKLDKTAIAKLPTIPIRRNWK